MAEFKKRLIAFRFNYGVTQKKMAELLHVNERSIRWWESGKIKTPQRLIRERFDVVEKRYSKKVDGYEVAKDW